jgi:hypothetical protein
LPVKYILAFAGQLLLVHIINPDTFDDLEDFISNIELVVELGIDTCRLGFNVELHESMQKIVVGKFHANQLVTQNTLL